MEKLDVRTEKIIEDFLAKAEKFLEEAKAISNGYIPQFSLVVRKAHDSVELALKVLFLIVGGDYPKPKNHNIGQFLTKEFLDTKLKDFPPYLIWEKIPHIRLISTTLAKWKDLAMYGDEEINAASNQIFGREEANFSIKGAEEIINSIRSFYYHYRYKVSGGS